MNNDGKKAYYVDAAFKEQFEVAFKMLEDNYCHGKCASCIFYPHHNEPCLNNVMSQALISMNTYGE
jgi:hypothetical protein